MSSRDRGWRDLPPGPGDFDAWYGTDTDGEIPVQMLAHSDETAAQAVSYEASDPLALRHMIGRLPVRHQDYTFVDLGSGKGRAVMLATTWPFRRVIGVEASPLLHAIARANLREWAQCGNDCRHVALRNEDAAATELPAEPTVLYLFNPFHARVMARVLLAVRWSLEQAPRDLWIVYYNPQLGYMFEATSWLAKVTEAAGFQQGDYAIWRVHGELGGDLPPLTAGSSASD